VKKVFYIVNFLDNGVALLEARGLPSHLLGALGPRMHHLLLRSSIGGSGEWPADLIRDRIVFPSTHCFIASWFFKALMMNYRTWLIH
jgi:hypothetical protein